MDGFNNIPLEALPCISFIGNMAVKANGAFLRLTGYNLSDIIGNTSSNIWNKLLRIDIDLDSVTNTAKALLFDKTRNIKAVIVNILFLDNCEERTYVFKEYHDNVLHESFPFVKTLYRHTDTAAAIFSAQDYILLDANENYFSLRIHRFCSREETAGTKVGDFVEDWYSNFMSEIWDNSVLTGIPHVDPEFHCSHSRLGDTYWDYNLSPVLVDGKVKYLILIIKDVTAAVKDRITLNENNKIIEQQNTIFEAVFENMSDGVILLDNTSSSIRYNRALRSLYGIAPDDTETKINPRAAQYFDRDENPIAIEELPICRTQKGEIAENFNIKMKLADRTLHLVVNGSPIYNSEGKLIGGVVCCVDVTGFVEQTALLHKKNKELNAIIDNMSDILLVFDRDNNYIKTNKAADILMPSLGLMKAGDLQTSAKYYDAQGRELSIDELPISKVKRGEKVRGNRFVIRTAERELHFDINGTPIFDENGGFSMGVLCCCDITEYISQTRTIRNQKEELEAIIENIEDAIFIYDKHGNHLLQNKTARSYYPELKLKEPGDGFIESRFYDLSGREIPKEDMPVSKVLHGQTIKNERLHMVRQDKSYYLDIFGRPILDSDGNVRLNILYCRDITTNIENEYKIKLQQDLLLKAEIEKCETLEKALALKDDFLSFISHEFKVPLTVISSALQTMEFICRDQIPEKAKKFLNTIRQNTNRQLRLVNNLLDITRINSGQLKVIKSNIDVVFLTGSIVNSVQLYAQQKDIRLSFFCELPCKIIDIDEEKYERILLNLLSNAIKYTASGKEVNVTLSMESRGGESLVCVAVQDEGIGIPPDQHEYIFERFGQVDSNLARQAEGTGIGLSLVKLLVATLGGKIELESEVGKGSTFRLLLPATLTTGCSEAAASIEYDSRLVQATAIEFSDIYF